MAKIERDQLVVFVIKVSTLIILCLTLLNVLNVTAQSIPMTQTIGRGKDLRQKVRQIYTSQIGVREKPSNSGPQVEKYLKYVGSSKGNPWCAAFVCWVLGEAGVENPRSGWSPDLFARQRLIWRKEASPVSGIDQIAIGYQESRFGAGKLYKLRRNYVDGINPACRSASPPRPITDYRLPITHVASTKTPQSKSPAPTTADLFGLYFPEKRRIAHVGFIDQWDGTWMISVEGNTNIAGSREGDGVYRKRRLVKSVYQVARYINH